MTYTSDRLKRTLSNLYPLIPSAKLFLSPTSNEPHQISIGLDVHDCSLHKSTVANDHVAHTLDADLKTPRPNWLPRTEMSFMLVASPENQVNEVVMLRD